MATKFGFLSKLEFLQDWASSLIAGINPAVMHNIEKYYTLKKVHYLSAIEDVEGDYLEFGVFTGSSFCHSLRCCRKLARLNAKILKTRFFGFDSFAGFGTLAESDKHPFYTDENFATSLSQVDRRIGRVARGGNIPIGYYNDPAKTAETFVVGPDGNRWSIPGDYATVEADGRITLLGRGSVSINSGSFTAANCLGVSSESSLANSI